MTTLPTTSTSPAANTYASLGLERLSSLWRATMHRECPTEVRDAFLELLGSWGSAPVPKKPEWPSAVTQDHTPFSFSVVLGGATPELHVLVEAQGPEASVASQATAALALNRTLASKGADLSRFELIKDLFLSNESKAGFALWHTAIFAPGKPASFGVCLNPQVRGIQWAFAIVEEAMDRLGMRKAWPSVAAVAHRCPPFDELRYVSLSLSNELRLDVHMYHHEVTAADLERSASGSPGYVAGGVTEFCKAIAGHEGPYPVPLSTRVTFVEGQIAPVSARVEIPVPFFTDSDRSARERIRGFLERKGLAVELYDQTLEAAARRPLEAGKGLQASVSFEPVAQPRVGLQLAPEAFQPQPAGPPEFLTPPLRPPEEIVKAYELSTIANHPYFQRARRNEVNVTNLWMMLMNIRQGIVTHFSRRLASVVARVNDTNVRSILAKQLNDELGDGDGTRAHSLLFEKFIAGLDAFKPEHVPADLIEPGKRWGNRLEELYVHRDAYEGVGASMVVEIIGKQADAFIADEFRRPNTVPKAALEWLDIHEKLELEHSDESMELAELMPDDPVAVASIWRGARECGACCWAVLDDLYSLCYTR